MTKIRVTYSGLISFAVGLASVITGTAFTLIVTRQFSSDELGFWTLIGGLLSYVVISESIISYWVTREIARGTESGRTAVTSSGIFSFISIIIYFVITIFIGYQTKIDKNILFFASILIPVMFLNRTLGAINFGWKPHASSYGIIIFEVSKVPAGLILVYFLHLGISGAILTTFIAYLLSTVIQLYYARDKIKKKIRIEFIKKWIKLSWLSYFPQISNLIIKLDVSIYAIIVGSVTGLAYYTAAVTVASLVGQAGNVSRALYPKLLEGDKHEYLQENLIRVFYFMIPLTALSIVFVRPALFALNPLYEITSTVAIFMIIRMFFNTLTGVFYPALTGIERVDVDEKSTFKDYLRSKLFLLPTLAVIQSSAYIIFLAVGFLVLASNKVAQLDMVIYWSVITLFTEVFFTVYLYFLIRKNFTLSIDYKSLLKYSLTSMCVFIPSYFLSVQFLEFKKSIFEFLPNLFLFVGLGMLCYLLITYFIDNRTKKLFNGIITEIRGRI
ncbi:MAG TPA: hypothetical protein VN704_13360 [Verrucomicrobiae bacterium]|nr:hypothetical protein [Verrucomicrobiae bacterium]